MNTKEAIEFMLNVRPGELLYAKNNEAYHEYKSEISKIDEVIGLLKRGEKFEQMWKLLKNKSGFRKIEHVFTEFQCTIEEIMESYEQKHFPKGND